MEEYEERYPGDEYVDLVGFDTYDNDPVTDEEGYTFQDTFEELVRLTDEFAKKHGKLFAVTETGVASSGAALKETGNKRPKWYTEMLDIMTRPEYDCCYFMLWSNYSRTGSYYTPFVEEVNEDSTLFGHELLDSFIEFYNNEKSISIPDSEAIDQNGEVAGVLYYDCIRAIHALNVDAPVFEALSGAESASAEPVQAQGTAATERKLKFGAVPAVAGTISVLSLLCLTGLAVGGRKKGGGKKDE